MDSAAATQIVNLPGWVVIAVGVASIVFCLLGLVLIGLIALIGRQLVASVGELTKTAQTVQDIVETEFRKEMVPEITGTLKNVRGISDDARATSKNVTTSINNVSHIVTGVTGRLESPVVRAVGVLTGLAAGARALKGRETTTVEVKKKKRGLFGR